MYRRLPLYAVLVVVVTAAAAGLSSPSEASRIALGPVVMVNQASFGGDAPPDHDYEGVSRFGGGIALDYYLRKDVALSIQPMYLQKGADLVWTEDDVELSRIELRSEYLSIPIALKVTGNSRSRMYAHGGIDFDFLLSADVSENGVSEDFKDGFEPFSIGASFGAGGLIAIGHNWLMIEARYTQGLDNIARRDFTTVGATSSVKTTGFMFIIGWLFSSAEVVQ